MKLKRLDNLINYKIYNACITGTSDDVIILDSVESKPMGTTSETIASIPLSRVVRSSPHEYSHICVEYEDKAGWNLNEYTAFQSPILAGWHRFGSGASQRYYRTPCMRYLHTIGQIDEYLLKTNSKLRIDCFDVNNCEIPEIHGIFEVGVELNQFCQL